MSIIVNETDCQNLREALRKEWLDTNGIGGYASSTIIGCNTRKYHGLLVANLAEPAGRFLLLSKYEDSVVSDGKEFSLACHRYPGVYHPQGHQYLEEFRLDAGPVFRYRIGDAIVTKRLLMVQGENTLLVRYDLDGGTSPIALRLKPLLGFRRHHELKGADQVIRTLTHPVRHGFGIHPYEGLPPLFIQASLRATFHPAPDWYHRFEYFEEADRGYDHHEDLFRPGILDVPLHPGNGVVIAASVVRQNDPSDAWEREVTRRRNIRHADAATAARSPCPRSEPAMLPLLIRSGRHFVIETPEPERRPTIIAGYPWFDDWGRDTLISLPGLTFCSGRPEIGVAILQSMGPQMRHGLIPNFFAANPAHHAYNSVDASLWYFWAVQQLLDWTRDVDTVRRHLWPVMRDILAAFQRGTDNGIGMSAEGLLRAGNRGTQLTWMDAQAYGSPVTPRHGYAVEINALWYNALCFSGRLAQQFGEPPPWPADLPERTKAAFVRTFWIEADNYLADVVTDGVRDTAVRPNQIFAVSLPFSPLDGYQKIAVVDRVRRELLTPYGLRTLSPQHPAYRGRYEGDQDARDAAYHQGTVWPWLLGHFGEACLRTSVHRRHTARTLLTEIRPLLAYSLGGSGLLNVPEIFDGDPPHRPNGCRAQAWSTAELIRLFTLCGPNGNE
jgi:predicted glycogen debranching enzyme